MVSKYLLLPMNISLSNNDVEHVCDNIIEFYSNVYEEKDSVVTV